MNSEERQALIARIEELKKQQSIPLEDNSPVYQQDLKIWEIALAALEAEPVGKFIQWDSGDEETGPVVEWVQATIKEAVPLYRCAPAPAIPAGWQLVPVDMTDETGEAIALEARCCGCIALDIYNAMLAAAPKP